MMKISRKHIGICAATVLLIVGAYAAFLFFMHPGHKSGKRLVEVEFAIDDKAPDKVGHTVFTRWISEKAKGNTLDIYGWAVHVDFSLDREAKKKALKCRQLIEFLVQPKDLPESPNDIVTVRCMDGDKTIEKRFPIGQAPFAVHEILLLADCGRDKFSRFTFAEPPIPVSKTLSSEIEKTVREELSHSWPDDLKAMQDAVHTESPHYAPPEKRHIQRGSSEHLFSYRLLSFRIVAMDGPFVYVRVKKLVVEIDRRTKKEKPEKTVDVLYVYCREKGVWKYWASAIMAEIYEVQDTEQGTSPIQPHQGNAGQKQ